MLHNEGNNVVYRNIHRYILINLKIIHNYYYILFLFFLKNVKYIISINLSLGNGKTYYIKQQMKFCTENCRATVAINEAFSEASVIHKLNSLSADKQCFLHLNFTLLPPGVILLLHVCTMKLLICSNRLKWIRKRAINLRVL